MIIRFVSILIFAFGSCVHSFSQDIVSRDDDGNIWLITDTIRNIMHYIDKNGHRIKVISIKTPALKKEELDSLIIQNQYSLWSDKDGYECFEPYASVIYAILFSKEMKIIEVRLLKREAYEKNPAIDNVIIKSIKGTKTIWKKQKRIRNKMNIIYVSRTRVVIPDFINDKST